MLCFVKRVLPFTLTLIVGSAVGGFFNLFGSSSDTRPAYVPPAPRFESSSSGRGCRSRQRNYSTTVRSAEIFYKPNPFYTEAARRNRTEGDVTLRVTLAADGTVSDVETITQLPDGLTEQARKAAKEIRFRPATRDGSPIDEPRTLTYTFDLD